MRLHRITLRNVRGIRESQIELATDGVTVIEGPNEAGKSSVAESLRLVLAFPDSSRHRDVLAVQPVGYDVGPEIEIEASSGPYRFVYAKRFVKRPTSTTLSITRPSPAQFTGRQAHERVEQILGETVDTALFDALQMMQGDSFTQPELAQIAPLKAALGTDEQAADGDRDLMESIEARAARYFTATGQPTGDLRTQRGTVQTLTERLAELDAAHEAVQHRLRRFERNRESADVTRSQQASARERLEDLREQYRRIADKREAVRAGQSQLTELQRVRDGATAAVAARTELTDELADAERIHADIAAELERTGAEFALVDARLDEARVRREAVAGEQAATRDRVRRVRAKLAYARQTEELSDLTERVRLARAADAEYASEVRAIAAASVDDDAVKKLADAHTEVLTAWAARDAQAPRLLVRRLGEEPVLVDGTPIPGEHEQAVVAAARVEVGGVVSIEVRPGEDSLNQRIVQAEARWAELSEEYGVESLEEARDLAEARRESARARDAARERRERVLSGASMDELTGREHGLRERLAALGEPPEESVRDLDTACTTAEGDAERAEEALENAATELRRCEEQASARRDALIRCEERAKGASGAVAATRTRVERARADADDASLERAVRDAELQLAAAADQVRNAERELAAEDPDSIELQVRNGEAIVDGSSTRLREIEDEQQRLLGELQRDEGLTDRRDEAAAVLQDAQRALEGTTKRADAAKLLADVMHRHRDEAQQRYVAPFKKQLDALGRTVFGPDFAVEIDASLRIVARTLRGDTVPFESLSGGAREQLCVLGRLAVAQLVDPDDGAPVILDDSLGFSDPDRLSRLGAVLHGVGRSAQIVVLTCQPSRFAGIGGARVVSMDRA